MTMNLRAFDMVGLPQRFKATLQGMFNLNDSKWGRDGEEKPKDDGAGLPPPTSDDKPTNQPNQPVQNKYPKLWSPTGG